LSIIFPFFTTFQPLKLNRFMFVTSTTVEPLANPHLSSSSSLEPTQTNLAVEKRGKEKDNWETEWPSADHVSPNEEVKTFHFRKFSLHFRQKSFSTLI